MNLFIASYRFKKPLTELYAATLPFMLILLLAVLNTYVPLLMASTSSRCPMNKELRIRFRARAFTMSPAGCCCNQDSGAPMGWRLAHSAHLSQFVDSGKCRPCSASRFTNWLNRLVPENDPLYTHVEEGPDDMHIVCVDPSELVDSIMMAH